MTGNVVKIGKRLESWKEIAAFFGRDERTVHRWEKELGMPVYRLPGSKGRVYAFSDELALWSAHPEPVRLSQPSNRSRPGRNLNPRAPNRRDRRGQPAAG